MVLIGIGLTSANILFPLNLWCGWVSCVLWGIAAWRMREWSLVVIELVAGLLYFAGMLHAHLGA